MVTLLSHTTSWSSFFYPVDPVGDPVDLVGDPVDPVDDPVDSVLIPWRRFAPLYVLANVYGSNICKRRRNPRGGKESFRRLKPKKYVRKLENVVPTGKHFGPTCLSYQRFL